MCDEFLIRMLTWEDNKKYPTMIKGFFSNSITEFLKLYTEAKKNEIVIDIPEEYEGRSKFDGKEAYVKELRIGFGGNEAITCLDVYVDVV
jgi:protein involved in sex pheromone biosynthesis